MLFLSSQTSTENGCFWQRAGIVCKHLTRALAPPSVLLHHPGVQEYKPVGTFKLLLSSYTSGLILLNYQIWLKTSALR